MYFCRYPGSGRFEGIPGEYPMELGNTEYLIHLTFIHICIVAIHKTNYLYIFIKQQNYIFLEIY